MNFSLALGVLTAVGVATMATADVQYRVVDLGSLGGFNSIAFAVNTNGDVAGVTEITDSSFRACVLTDTGLVDLGIIPGTAQSFGLAIDSSSHVVGASYDLGGMTYRAFRAGPMTPITELGQFSPRGMNDVGVVVGTVRAMQADQWISQHACVFQSGLLTELSSLGGDTSHAFDVNNSGVIVGASTLATQRQPHATMWIAGSPADLGTLGGNQSEAKAINESGVAVGHSTLAGGAPRACRFAIGGDGTVTRTSLGTLPGAVSSYANAINDLGTIVGVSDSRAFVYTDAEGMLDLNDSITPGSGWVLRTAHGINNSGVIVGTGLFGGLPHGFKLIPVTCPGDLNADNTVDVDDLNIVLSGFGTEFDVDDLNSVLSNWGLACP